MRKYLDNWTFKHYNVIWNLCSKIWCCKLCTLAIWLRVYCEHCQKTFVLGSTHPVPPISPLPKTSCFQGSTCLLVNAHRSPLTISRTEIYTTRPYFDLPLWPSDRAKTSVFRRQQCRRPLPQNMRSGLGGDFLVSMWERKLKAVFEQVAKGGTFVSGD